MNMVTPESATRLNSAQRILAMATTPAWKKAAIMRWRERGFVTGDEAESLIRANNLETA